MLFKFAINQRKPRVIRCQEEVIRIEPITAIIRNVLHYNATYLIHSDQVDETMNGEDFSIDAS